MTNQEIVKKFLNYYLPSTNDFAQKAKTFITPALKAFINWQSEQEKEDNFNELMDDIELIKKEVK